MLSCGGKTYKDSVMHRHRCFYHRHRNIQVGGLDLLPTAGYAIVGVCLFIQRKIIFLSHVRTCRCLCLTLLKSSGVVTTTWTYFLS